MGSIPRAFNSLAHAKPEIPPIVYDAIRLTHLSIIREYTQCVCLTSKSVVSSQAIHVPPMIATFLAALGLLLPPPPPLPPTIDIDLPGLVTLMKAWLPLPNIVNKKKPEIKPGGRGIDFQRHSRTLF